MADPIDVDLTPEERELLRSGLVQWMGPARVTDAFAVAMGWDGRDHLLDDVARLVDAVAAGDPLPEADWRRALLGVEVVFASDVVGAGLDWAICTGYSDEETVRLLRGIQRRMPRWRASAQFAVGDDGKAVVLDTDRPDAAR